MNDTNLLPWTGNDPARVAQRGENPSITTSRPQTDGNASQSQYPAEQRSSPPYRTVSSPYPPPSPIQQSTATTVSSGEVPKLANRTDGASRFLKGNNGDKSPSSNQKDKKIKSKRMHAHGLNGYMECGTLGDDWLFGCFFVPDSVKQLWERGAGTTLESKPITRPSHPDTVESGYTSLVHKFGTARLHKPSLSTGSQQLQRTRLSLYESSGSNSGLLPTPRASRSPEGFDRSSFVGDRQARSGSISIGSSGRFTPPNDEDRDIIFSTECMEEGEKRDEKGIINNVRGENWFDVAERYDMESPPIALMAHNVTGIAVFPANRISHFWALRKTITKTPHRRDKPLIAKG
jgi:hypothetical protein